MQRTRRGLIFALSLGVVIVASGCARGERNSSRSEPTRVSTFTAVKWLAPDSLIVLRRDQFSELNVGKPACDSTGFYLMSRNTPPLQWRVGESLCEMLVLASGDRVDLGEHGKVLLYADVLRSGEIVKIDLDDFSTAVVVRECLPASQSPAWSPDEQRLAFVANCESPDAAPFLHLAAANGSDIRPIGPAADSLPEDGPSWAPDGSLIAVVRGGRDSISEIAVVDIVSGERHTVAKGHQAAWSPRGEWIAYLRRGEAIDSPASIRLVRPDGTGDQALFSAGEGDARDTRFGERVFGPLVWSPDGRSVAFMRGVSVWMIDLDRTGLRRLAPAVH